MAAKANNIKTFSHPTHCANTECGRPLPKGAYRPLCAVCRKKEAGR